MEGAQNLKSMNPLHLCTCVTNPKEDYTKKKNYLSVSWPGSRIKDLSAVSSQWRFSNVVLFLILEPFHSASLLPLYWRSTIRGEWCSKRSMPSAHTCSNEEVMLLTSIKIFLSHGGGVSSSLTKVHTGGNQRPFEYRKSHFQLWGPQNCNLWHYFAFYVPKTGPWG